MAKNQSRRLKLARLQTDENGFAALAAIKAYASANPAYSMDAVAAIRAEVARLRQTNVEAFAKYVTAREAMIAKEWEFHNLMLGVKAQIIAQFGADSDELHAIGLKKRSEYKPPGRKIRSDIYTE